MPRRTKIVATLGPASSDKKTLARMIEAGLDVVRMNFSHGTANEHAERVELVRALARKAGRSVGVLVDLQGPKIRIGRFEHDRVMLNTGDKFVLDAECKLGDASHVGLDYKNLPQDVSAGDTLLLDDGRIVLAVTAVKGPRIYCVVEQGGALSNNKGINRKGGGLTAPALTEKDMQDIKTAAQLKADLSGGVVSALGRRYPVGARPDAESRRQGAAVRQDRARRSDSRAGRNRRCVGFDHGGARRPRGGGRRRRGSRAAKAHDPHGARAQQAGDHRDADDGVDDQTTRFRRARKCRTSPTPCSTAPTR